MGGNSLLRGKGSSSLSAGMADTGALARSWARHPGPQGCVVSMPPVRWPACSFSHASQPCPRFPKDFKFYAIKVSSLLLHALERSWSLKDYTNTHLHSLLLTWKIFESEFTSSGNVQLFKQAHYYCQKPHSLDGSLECTYTCACTHTAQGGSRLTAASAQSSVYFCYLLLYYFPHGQL